MKGEVQSLTEQLLPAVFAVRLGRIGAVFGEVGIIRVFLIIFGIHAGGRRIKDVVQVAFIAGLQH
jgi:hypothetical protein